MENNITQGLELMLKGLKDLTPKDIDKETKDKIDKAIKDGTSDILKLKKQMNKIKKEVNF